MTKEVEEEDKKKNAEDEDSEADEDYVPEPDEQGEDGGGVAAGTNEEFIDPIDKPLTESKQKAVDEAFESLFGRSSSSSGKNNPQMLQVQSLKGGKKNRKKLSRKRKLLAGIFGSGNAEKMMNVSFAKKKKTRVNEISDDQLASLVESVKERTAETEVRRFAGQDVFVRSTASTRNEVVNHDKKNTKRTVNGVDKVLSDIAGPQKITTGECNTLRSIFSLGINANVMMNVIVCSCENKFRLGPIQAKERYE